MWSMGLANGFFLFQLGSDEQPGLGICCIIENKGSPFLTHTTDQQLNILGSGFRLELCQNGALDVAAPGSVAVVSSRSEAQNGFRSPLEACGVSRPPALGFLVQRPLKMVGVLFGFP